MPMIVHYRLYHTHFLVGNADIITCACTTLIVHYALLHWLLIADTPTGRAASASHLSAFNRNAFTVGLTFSS